MARTHYNDSKTKWFVIVPVAILVLAFLSRFFVTISAGFVGVVTQFGRVTGRTLDPGLHWLAPWQACERFDCRVQKVDGRTECFSKDLQLIDIDVSILTTLPPAKATHVYQSIGRNYINQVIPRVWEILPTFPLR